MKRTKKLTALAMLAAISVVLVYLIHFPIFPSADYLEYDPADIPILMGGFAFGPLAGLALTVTASVIQALTVSAKSGVYGFVMHVVATTALVMPSSLIYRKHHSKKGAVIGLAAGTAAMCAVMVVANHFITPYYTGMPAELIDPMLLPVILPFNFIKAGGNSLVTFLLYKRVSTFIKGL